MRRFAIYFALPEYSPLNLMASAWLGRSQMEPPRNGFTPEVWGQVTSDPRVYGFHATLKPPFRLVAGRSEKELFEKVQAFAKTQRAFTAPPLQVSAIASFLALTLTEPCPTFEALAADCVREFDEFRAPPSEEELDRRRRAKLNLKQLEYLTQWGYPYVMEEWRFHMTLTSSLEKGLLERLRAHLENLFGDHCRKPTVVDAICIFEQPAAGELFHIAERFAFA